MSNQKLITICIATYNRSDRVTNLIKTLLSFELNNEVEILIIDDYSSDNTFENLSQFSDVPNVSVYRNQQNLSRARTHLKYFNLCKTEFLVELADDDYLLKDGLLELLDLLPKLDVDFLSTRWIDPDGSLQPGRGSDKVQDISLTNLRRASEHSIGCVFRASMIRHSEKYLLKRLDRDCVLAFFWHQNIVLCMAMLNNLTLVSCPIILGGYPTKDSAPSNLIDPNGNKYFSLTSAFNKYLGLKEFYEDMLEQFPESPLFDELTILSNSHNLSLYNSIDDAIYIHDISMGTNDLNESFRVGSMRNFLNPFKFLKYFFWFMKAKFNTLKYK
ncbi:glycosyltransferase family 2 protein [Gammaproteobacteria bacterium]|nr:glycosyltransferase family 2 protein [Gammaproteobacteria bacterium]